MWNNYSDVSGADRSTPRATPKQWGYIENLCKKLDVEMGRILDAYDISDEDDLDIATASQIISSLKAQNG